MVVPLNIEHCISGSYCDTSSTPGTSGGSPTQTPSHPARGLPEQRGLLQSKHEQTYRKTNIEEFFFGFKSK